MVIERINAATFRAARPGLVALLQDAVESGASVGFLPPLDTATAQRYWDAICDDVVERLRVLLVAREDNTIIGAVQLELAQKPGEQHRAQMKKLMVLRSARRRGVARALLAAVEEEARREGRSLLILDTREGEPAERLYQACGYTFVGRIPKYARSADGSLHTAVIYYRLL